MDSKKEYIYNQKQLIYEPYKASFKKRWQRGFLFLVVNFCIFLLLLSVFRSKVDLRTLKLMNLQSELITNYSDVAEISRRLDVVDNALVELQNRDNSVYRSIFGLDSISSDIRNAGFGGVDKYAYLRNLQGKDLITRTSSKMDILYKKAYIQTESLDEISLLSRKAGEMSACIPSISPVAPNRGVHRISSNFGNRIDPFNHKIRFHAGIDICAPLDSDPEIYATGNGTIEVAANNLQLGKYVVINHGFGYKTKYAHLKSMNVERGQEVKRGDVIGIMGDTGTRSTGTHLHYEVIYKNKRVNPSYYFDFDIEKESYFDILGLK